MNYKFSHPKTDDVKRHKIKSIRRVVLNAWLYLYVLFNPINIRSVLVLYGPVGRLCWCYVSIERVSCRDTPKRTSGIHKDVYWLQQ